MGGWLQITAIVKSECLKEFKKILREYPKYEMNPKILATYDIGDYKYGLVHHIFLKPEWMGYAQPMELYQKIKDLIKDMWYMEIDVGEKIGCNNPCYRYS